MSKIKFADLSIWLKIAICGAWLFIIIGAWIFLQGMLSAI